MTEVEGLINIALDEIKYVMKQRNWKENELFIKQAQKGIDKLMTITMTTHLLKSTGAGKLLRSLSKHTNPLISGYSLNLVKKWKKAIGMIKEDPGPSKLELARSNIIKKYADEKKARDLRTCKVLSQPVQKKNVRNNKVIVSSSYNTSSRTQTSSSVSTMRRQEQCGVFKTSSAVQKREPTGRSVSQATSSRRGVTGRPASAHSSPNMQRRGVVAKSSSRKLESLDDHLERTSSFSRAPRGSKSTTLSRSKPGHLLPRPNTARREMLERLYPRIRRTVENVENHSGKSKKASSSFSSQSIIENPIYIWLKSRLIVDMSKYASLFIDAGIDSMVYLSSMREREISKLILKSGDARDVRIISEAIGSLSSRKRKAHDSRVYKKKKKGLRSADEYDSEDGDFIDSEDDIGEYQTGIIGKMMERPNHRYGRGGGYSDENDSSDMEASHDQMREEEARTERIGNKVDRDEARRNERLEKAEESRKKQRRR